MNFLKSIFKRPVTITFAIVMAIVWGIISASGMAINLLPDISFPYLSVQTVYAGADAETVDKNVTEPLEKSLSQITGIHEISTYSLDNASIILLQFDYGTDTEKKQSEMQAKIDEVALPDGCGQSKISTIDLNATSIYSLTIYAKDGNVDNVLEEANKLKSMLTAVGGVGSVKLSGAPTVSLKIETINGLELLAGVLVQNLAQNSALDIPLGEVNVSGGSISVNNHSRAETVEAIKNTTIGIPLSNSERTYISTAQDTIKNIEKLNVEDTEKLKKDADDMNEFIDKLEDMTPEELDDLVENLSVIKSLVETIEGNTAGGLRIMWNQVLKNLFEDEAFKSLTEDELHDMADTYNVSYGLLKWLQDNAEIDEETGKTLAEGKWDKIVAFREAHPKDVEDSDYVDLFYEIEIVSDDPEDEDYMSEEDIEKAVSLSRTVNTVALNSVVETLKDGEQPTDSEYAMLFAYAGNEYDIPITGMTIKIIRSEHFEENYEVFHAYKLTHQHEEVEVDEDTQEEKTVLVGDDIPSADFIAMYRDMVWEDEWEVEPTERLLDFIRTVDLTDTAVKMKVSDMADVYLQTKYESSAYYNSTQAIQLDVFGAGESNATAIANEAKRIIENYNASTDEFVVVSLNNQADFINDSLSNALVSLLIGSLLAVAVIYLFLRKVKSSLIIAVSMPLSVLLTLICLSAMGITLNMVSVGGIAVGIGMLVDNSIVVLESVTSEKEKGKSVLVASVDGVKLVLGSLVGSTLTSICVFFPILFINGLTKEIFADLSWAVIFSLSFSLIVAVTVIPTLFCLFYRERAKKTEEVVPSAKTSKPEKAKKERKGKFFEVLTNWYLKVLRTLLRRKGATIAIILVVALGFTALGFTCPIEFLPSIDQHRIQVNVNFTAGDKAEYCQEKTMQAYTILSENLENVEYLSESVGFAGLIETSRQGVITVQLKDEAKASKLVVEDIRELFEGNGFDVDYSVVEQDGVVASLTGGMSGISVSIYGKEVDTLKEIAVKIEEDVKQKTGIKHTSDNMLDSSTSYDIKFDHDKLVERGIDYATIVQTLRIGLAGYDVYEVTTDDDKTDVTVRWKEDSIGSYYESLHKFIVGIDGDEESFVHLEDVAEINEVSGRHVIRKTNGLNVLQINVEAFGIDTNTASNYLTESAEKVLSAYEGYDYAKGGVSYYLTDAFSGLIVALAVSFVLLFGVMACLFESLKKPIIIIFSFPFAFAGGFLALAISRVSLNVVSFIGLIMLMGVIINDAIVLNERFDQLREDGLSPQDAVTEGCRQRLRAVLMTTLTTVLALIPMALGLGKGGALMQPLGIVAIGGMTIGTIVTLILIPCVYAVAYRIKFDKKQ